jgi:acyl-CoA synthetase (AMP-forming)/AMP-acid ligase II
VYQRCADEGRVDQCAKDLDHDVLVSDRDLPSQSRRVVQVRELVGPALGSEFDDSEATLLVLTTGTTGLPKAARHQWSRLMPRADRHRDDDARWLLAFNLNQFAGLQVLLHVLASRATLVIPESHQPRGALDAIRTLGVTHASGTPTFWRFLCALLDGDLEGLADLRQITLGGESVPRDLLADLSRKFPHARVSQVYATTEIGSAVSVRDGKPGLPLSVLDRGPGDDVQLKVVDGELFARSQIGMLGYLHQPVETEGWVATGDLVEVTDDRILFIGRSTDVINVGGVKVHPQPIEDAITAVVGVTAAHVYGKSNAVTGQIVVADVLAADTYRGPDLDDAIRAACADLPRAWQPRRIRFVHDLGLQENKIVRHAEESTDA